ncbi:family 43 glycosylhydrolase [Coraliomargarita algicola]|uniref:Family 43 glycosylhydrolase n=1 Tax=Coraliomargarita algicola TaxID=3092156 RepID=A0ABZ0RI06_9BACT|nr:family 43 glycosylhydrolase [Coraliomargarita sp. J2-16]WPJ95834.1 family 43 glycosylhydrolase [Coraliomargarita sp. J2-16]
MANVNSSNPILAGMHPDPTVCRVGKYFYLATSSFGQFPGVPLYRSEDLNHWEFVRHILSRPEQLSCVPHQKLGNAGIFAPSLRYHNGTFYMVTTLLGHKGHFFVTAEDPAGEWSDPFWIDEAHRGGIDPSLTFLEDGTVLFQSTADGRHNEPQGIIQFEIDPKTGEGLTPRKYIAAGYGDRAVEAPHVYQKGDYWYLMTAEGGTESNHRVSIGRSKSVWGPWDHCPHNPILTHCGVESPIQHVGHGDLFDDADGNWWIVFLAVRPQGYPPVHLLGRETFIAPVRWDEDGWPVVNENQPIQLSLDASKALHAWEDNFDDKTGLHHRWVTIGRAYREVYSLKEGETGLQLIAQTSTLAVSEKKAWVGARMTQPQATYHCEIQLESSDTEVGLTAFMEAFGYYSLGVREAADGSAIVRLTQRVLDLEKVTEVVLPKQESYHLQMKLQDSPDEWTAGDASRFIFSVQTAAGDWQEVGRGASRNISTELIGGYGGLFAGIYCIGETGATGRVLQVGCSE